MKISLNWLKEYIDLPKGVTPEDIALKLTMATVEVEEIIDQQKDYANMVVGEIVEIVDHPQADRLKVCKVKAGKNSYQIVCGGNNIYKGLKGILALPGARVKWHGAGNPVILEKTAIRGIESEGMLCAAEEIGLPVNLHASGGIVDLPGVKAGQSAAEALGLNDVIFEVDNKSVTNRPDLWGHYGVAREIAALFNLKLKDLKVDKIKEGSEVDLKIEIQDEENCSRYIGAVVSGIKISPSPVWMQLVLSAVGVRPINNIVDITNFVMLELGRPSHAFDRRDVTGDTIIVRRAQAGEKFKTLDGQERELTDQMCLVCDAAKPVDLAGIMGGANSEIKPDTTEVIFELANFNPVNIRKTASALNLRTEAAVRFEKGLDPALADLGLKRILTLVNQLIPGATVISRVVDVNLLKEEDRLIELDLDFLNKRIGQVIPKKEVIGILERLSFVVKDKGETLLVTPPSFRVAKDISIPEDLVEEVARIYGYENIVPQLPLVDMTPPEENLNFLVGRKVKDILSGILGQTEVYNYSFAPLKSQQLLGLKKDEHLEVANYLSDDARYLKVSLFENLIRNLESNLRFYDSVQIFELGRAYLKSEGSFNVDSGQKSFLAKQDRVLAGLYFKAKNPAAFFNAKGLVEILLSRLEIDYHYAETIASKNIPSFVAKDSYLAIKTGDVILGWVGELNLELADQLGAKNKVGVWQLSFELLVKFFHDKLKYQTLPKYPAMIYDFSIIVDKNQAWSVIKQEVMELNSLVKRVELFDVFNLEKLGPDARSLAFHVTLLDENKTLTSTEGDELKNKIINLLKTKFKAEVR